MAGATGAIAHIMEGMVEDLEALVSKSLLSAEEGRAVAARRASHEHKLRRRVARRADYTRYVEYEKALNELLKKRRARLGLSDLKKTKADYSVTKHCAFVYERALRKFKDDQSLWRDYFAFLRATRSHKALQKALAKALALHPTSAGMWLYAAGFEYSVQGNAAAARKLLQRGLRMNGGSQRLWVESFAFELRYARGLRLRRETLGLSMPVDGGEEDPGRAALAEVLAGEAGARVVRNACDAEQSKVADKAALAAALAAKLGETRLGGEQPRAAAAVDAALAAHADDARCVIAAARRAASGAADDGAAAAAALRAGWEAAPTADVLAAAVGELRRMAAEGELLPSEAAAAVADAVSAAAAANVSSEVLAIESVGARLAAGDVRGAEEEAEQAAAGGMCALEAVAGSLAAARGEGVAASGADAGDARDSESDESDSDEEAEGSDGEGAHDAANSLGTMMGAAADGSVSFDPAQAARLAALPGLPASEAAWHAALVRAAAAGCPAALRRAVKAAGEERLRTAPGTPAAESADRLFVCALHALADAAGVGAARTAGAAADQSKRSAPLSRCLAALAARAGSDADATARLREARAAGGGVECWLDTAALEAARGGAAALDGVRARAAKELSGAQAAAFREGYAERFM